MISYYVVCMKKIKVSIKKKLRSSCWKLEFLTSKTSDIRYHEEKLP